MNPVRGETTLEVNGKKYTLLLTMGALAEIEAALGVTTMGEMSLKMMRMGSMDLLRVVCILIKYGMKEEVPWDEALTWPPNIPAYTDSVKRAFIRGGFMQDPDAPAEETPKGPKAKRQ